MSYLHLTVILRRIVFVAMFMVAVAGTVVSPVRGAETQAPEEWIFSVVMLPQWSITDGILAYQFKGGYYLPIVELAEAYEFFVESETDRAFVSGFAGREENSFTIDGERAELVIKGEREALPVDSILPKELLSEDVIYVRLDILNKIWPVEMKTDLSSLVIYVTSEEELSFVRRKKRADKKIIYEARRKLQASTLKNLPFQKNPYLWFGKPVLDLQSSYRYDNRTKILTGSNNISGTQQLGKVRTNFSLNSPYIKGKLRKPDVVRANFLRQATGDDHLLVPTLKRVEFGDVGLGQRSLISNNAGGRGFVLSNRKSSQTREFDRITVEGVGPAGWELELYNNNDLLEFGVVEDNGEYIFENIVLHFGHNRIRVVMYGPQGQIKENVFEYNIKGGGVSPGDFKYRAGIVDTSRPLIALKPGLDPKLPLTKNAEFSYGLNTWLSLFGSYTKIPLNNKEKQYYTGGVSFSTPIGLGEAEGYREVNGGKAIDLRFITQILGVSLNLRSSFFRDFKSLQVDSTRFNTEIQANTNLNLPFLPMGLRVKVDHRELLDGNVFTTLDVSESFTGGGLIFGHSTNSIFKNEVHETSTGSFNVNWNKGRWQARGAGSYKIYPLSQLSNAVVNLTYKAVDSFQAALNVNHNFLSSLSGSSFQLGYDFKDILSTLTAGYQQERGWIFSLRASTSLNPYNPGHSYKLSSNSKKSYAPVLGRVFLDNDGDGTFGEGDEPLEGISLNIDRGRSQTESDGNGYVVATLSNNQKMGISVDQSSLEDPYFKPSVEGYSTVGLKGTMPDFEFPIVETGAIDGTVWADPSGQPVSGMKLELLSEDGSVYMSTKTAFDGYYAFEFVLPGTYTVRADPSYQVNVPAETVTVSSEEIFAFGVDLYLLEPVAEEKAAEQADGESGGVAQTYHAPVVSGTEQPALQSSPGRGSSSAVEKISSHGGSSSIVKDVRIGEYPDKIRLVLDLSVPIAYDIQEGAEGLVILIDMPHANWEAKAHEDMIYSAVMKGFDTETLKNGGTRLILKARQAMKVIGHEILPATKDKPARLYIDLASM